MQTCLEREDRRQQGVVRDVENEAVVEVVVPCGLAHFTHVGLDLKLTLETRAVFWNAVAVRRDARRRHTLRTRPFTITVIFHVFLCIRVTKKHLEQAAPLAQLLLL